MIKIRQIPLLQAAILAASLVSLAGCKQWGGLGINPLGADDSPVTLEMGSFGVKSRHAYCSETSTQVTIAYSQKHPWDKIKSSAGGVQPVDVNSKNWTLYIAGPEISITGDLSRNTITIKANTSGDTLVDDDEDAADGEVKRHHRGANVNVPVTNMVLTVSGTSQGDPCGGTYSGCKLKIVKVVK
jgi:hypothetical protein